MIITRFFYFIINTLYYMFNILVGLLIVFITIPARLISKIFKWKFNLHTVCRFLDKYFPLPDENYKW